jgi:Chromate transporter
VLAYVAQQAVEHYHWLRPGEMLDGLGMAETTPAPLIMATQFVGFMAAYRDPAHYRRDHMRAELTIAALTMAIQRQKPPPGLIHDSDRGSQYAAADYHKVLSAAEMPAALAGSTSIERRSIRPCVFSQSLSNETRGKNRLVEGRLDILPQVLLIVL